MSEPTRGVSGQWMREKVHEKCDRELETWITAAAKQDARIAELEQALRAVEWDRHDGRYRWCSQCLHHESMGHAPDCIVGNALRAEG